MDVLIQEPCGNTVDYLEDFDEESVLNLGIAINAIDVDIEVDPLSGACATLIIDRTTCTVHPKY